MKSLIRLLFPVLLAVSCVGRELVIERGEVDVEGTPIGHEMIVLGDRLEDPYSVENMTQALVSLYPTKAERVVLPATHWYVRFLPENEEQYGTLERLGLQLLDHPVDYEILREGDYYHDPAIAADRITWQYAVVPAEFSFPPGIRHELLEKCYIPGTVGTKADDPDWAAVEAEAFRLTGNEALLTTYSGSPGRHSGLDPESLSTKAGESAKPAGRITLVDKELGATEGVRGVMVSCNTFVKFASAYTDDEGRYAMTKSFSSRPRFRLVFKNSAGFSIGLNLLLVPASVSTLGTHEADGTDVEITDESDRWLYLRSIVNNAGYDYFRRCASANPAVKNPPGNLRFWLFRALGTSCAPMLQQGVLVDELGLDKLLGEYASLVNMFLPDILLGLKGKESYGEIYAEALHELAHTSHFMLAGKDYWNTYANYVIKSFITSGFVAYGVGTGEGAGHCEVGELWAYALQAQLYRERYGETDRTFGLNHWFHPQIFLQLMDRGLAYNKLFQVLNGEVTDRTLLQKKLTSWYPEYKSEINQAFARYN